MLTSHNHKEALVLIQILSKAPSLLTLAIYPSWFHFVSKTTACSGSCPIKSVKLENITLQGNKLTGHIPKELGFLPKLRKLYLGENNLTVGETSSSLGNISTLQALNLVECGLTGSLPMDLCHYWPTIEFISFSYNKFTGQLPSRIDRCRELAVLSLSYNKLVGSIPQEIGSLQKLKVLYLGSNSLTGTIPPTVGSNSLSGTFPSHSRVCLPDLEWLDFTATYSMDQYPLTLVA
ncbi:LRR receptor-like serine/threonine-protein kinase FLS2 [Prunus yedoensis var. nudiflora]|uniref:LRR receptor-like serine/threonine-protein kinase FLS2 n=1 Tax=Prunus yedoensis var. nudiflora TaxID=2094558 RepID=A0A314UW13_PRUYE|nr:LRR receptor-like serine/threonine-protein kinase FLS2 [Prunus yedoensis var. nudiflora]